MKIHVLNELRETIGAQSYFDLERTELLGEGLEIADLHGHAATVRTDRGLLVTVSIEGLLREQCSRCLQPASSPVHLKFSEEFLPVVDPNTGARTHFADSADAFRIPADFFLDLTESIRQYILMSEPAKPLCKPDCKGLCPECGQDWNQGLCGCVQATDVRWATLATLTRKTEGR